MSLTLALNNALTGLRVNQQSISVLSHNIANVNTDGYSRQIVDQSALYIDGVGSGVRIDDIVRKVDKYLQRAVQTQGAEVARTNVVNDYYERIQVMLGQPGAQNSLDSFMTGFFNALQSLGQTPDRTSSRSQVLSAATKLADEISGLSYDVNELRFEADREIRESVTAVNDILRRLDHLNLAITTAGATGQPTTGLLDSRDIALRDLAGYMDISTSFGNYGAVNVITGDGVSLVDGTTHRELRYSPTQSTDNFINNNSLNPLTVVTIDSAGNMLGNPTTLISAGTAGSITSQLTGGKIEGLRMMRDDVLPAMISQLDMLASNLRDAVNTVHNDGSGSPAASSLTGTRGVVASESYNWAGSVRIAVLKSDGSPVPAGYADEAYTGRRPLTLNLAQLSATQPNGQLSMQNIVDEINQHFAAPEHKAKLSNLNNIQMVSATDALFLNSPSLFTFDFEVENISGENAPFFVNGVTVLDDTGTNITNVTQPAPQLLLDPANSYTTTAGINDVTINFATNPGVQVGDTIYLGPPAGADVNGIPAAAITGYFTVTAVSGNGVTFQANAPAVTGGSVADPSGAYIQKPYITAGPGSLTRTPITDHMQVNLGLSPSSAYYDITVSVGTVDEDGNVQTSNITYRIQNGQSALLNDRYSATAVTGAGERVTPQTTEDAMRAILVDENGVELRKENNRYIDHSPSYLKLLTTNGEYTIAIDELDSRQLGSTNTAPPTAGTNWGFSHYFGLNDFFVPNKQTASGDTVAGSAINLAVAQRLLDNPNLISTGELVLQNPPSDPTAPPQWTYVRHSGDNQLVARLSALSSTTITFDAAGGLPKTGLTFSGYTSEFLGYTASRSAAASDEAANAQTLYDGFKNRSDSISGVNLDEELANTVIFQNAYAATARIVTVVNKMFDDIMNMI